MSEPKTPIDRLLDAVTWRELNPQGTWKDRLDNELAETLVATHEGTLDIMGHSLRVYQLSDGRRIIACEDLERFFGGVTDAGDPQTGEALIEARVAERFRDFDGLTADHREDAIDVLADIVRDQERRLVALEMRP